MVWECAYRTAGDIRESAGSPDVGGGDEDICRVADVVVRDHRCPRQE